MPSNLDAPDPADTKRLLLELLKGEQAASPRSAAPDDPFAASLVRLQAAGDKRPFFCVHPGSGTAGCFAEVAQAVDPDRPFIGIQPPGIDGECEPFDDIVTLAQGYVRRVRSVQPHGPYLLGGWSAGGSIAFQMAHELRQAGEEVGLVALFDTFHNNFYGLMPRPAVHAVMRHQMALSVEHLARVRGKVIPQAVASERFRRERPRSLTEQIALMFQMLEEAGAIRTAGSPLFKVFRANLAAVETYVTPAAALDAHLTLFRCDNRELGFDEMPVDASYGWQPHTRHPVEVLPMPSHHFALFHGEVAARTARALRSCLDRADPGERT